jgi:hypothetical protein
MQERVYYLPVGLYSTTTEAVEMHRGGRARHHPPPPGTSRFSFPAPQRTQGYYNHKPGGF